MQLQNVKTIFKSVALTAPLSKKTRFKRPKGALSAASAERKPHRSGYACETEVSQAIHKKIAP